MGEIKRTAYQNLIMLQQNLLRKTSENEKIKRDFHKEKRNSLLTLLEFSDNYDNVLSSVTENENAKFLKRIKILKRKYDRILIEMGVENIDTENLDITNIDPKYVVVVENVSNDDSQNDSTTIEVLKRGYLYQGEVLRPVEIILRSEDEA